LALIIKKKEDIMNICIKRAELTQKDLKKELLYDKRTGDWRWIKSKAGRMIEYSAGTNDSVGRRIICINGLTYTSSRLAFLYVKGSFPKYVVRHKNGNKNDDSWKNLEDVKIKDVSKFRKLDIRNKSGFTGVYYLKDNEKWRASITVEGTRIELGLFLRKNDAIRARKKANKKYGFK
jgi:hypothetical protein